TSIFPITRLLSRVRRRSRLPSRRWKELADSSVRSDLDLAAELDDAVARDTEILGRAQHRALQEDEEPLAPARQAMRVVDADDLLAADEERGLKQVDAEIHQSHLRQGAWDV